MVIRPDDPLRLDSVKLSVFNLPSRTPSLYLADPLSKIYQGAFVSIAYLAEECQFLPLSTILIALQDILDDLLPLTFCLVFEDQLLEEQRLLSKRYAASKSHCSSHEFALLSGR